MKFENSYNPCLFVNPIVFVLFALLAFSCSNKKEIEILQQINSIDSSRAKLVAYQDFIDNYPNSDSSLLVSREILSLFTALNTPDAAVKFVINQLCVRSASEYRTLLYSYLFKQILKDSLTYNSVIIQDREYQQYYSLPAITAEILFPYLKKCFYTDSLLIKYSKRFANFILQTENIPIVSLRQQADILVSYGNPDLIPISSRLLSKAVSLNVNTELDSRKINNYHELYILLAWNAYRLEKWNQALNLISQATKYGDLNYQNGLILLGAAQVKTGELNEGWGRVLEGLIRNPNAEKESLEINEIYISLFREIRGIRDNPERFLNQYRRSHR